MVESLLNIVFGAVFAAAFIIASGYVWQWVYMRPTGQDETLYFKTADGWRLAVHHYKAGENPDGYPVILCHGLSSNRFVFDLPGEASLARFLADRGRDVWVAELRGSGMSDGPGLFVSESPYSWDFDDHLTKDLPAILQFVLFRTGASKVHYIGHSMGGMLILAYLASQDDPPVASAVTVGSPANFAQARNPVFDFLLKVMPLIERLSVSPLPLIGRNLTPFAQWLSKYLLGAFFAANVRPVTARKIVALAAELVASNTLWLTFGRYLKTGLFADPRGNRYLENLAASKVPILVTGGSKDMMAPEASVRAACDFEAGNSGERNCVMFGRASGCVEDYGHMDLLVGLRVEQEVFPVILHALKRHDSARSL
ncbi:MAG TPA: alpha/beta hydrolase [Desulfomonilaceae bacterium]|nr:alpha/beta hydrolase [Desulfomonilaceae bacterium]